MKSAVLLLLLLAACASEALTIEQQAYKEYCASHNGAWMKMSELHEGKPTGNTCFGCMPDEKNHLCAQAEYEAFGK